MIEIWYDMIKIWYDKDIILFEFNTDSYKIVEYHIIIKLK